MVSRKRYEEAYRRNLVDRYLQSGLNRYQFCHLQDVNVSEKSIRRWVIRYKGVVPGERKGDGRTEGSGTGAGKLNIACYTIGESAGSRAGVARQVPQGDQTLAGMVRFHTDVQECCIRLCRLGCTRESRDLVTRILEVI